MFKRMLAFALVACLVCESAPMIAYAAEPQIQTVVEDSTEETLETNTEVSDVETPETEEEMPETGEEMPETGEEMPETGEEMPETGEEMPETGEEMPESGEETPEAGTEVPEIEVSVTEEVPVVELEEEVVPTEVSLSENSLEGTTDEMPALQYGMVHTITIPRGEKVWYSFTATEEGYYNFFGSNNNDVSISLFNSLQESSFAYDYGYAGDGIEVFSRKLEKDETIYVRLEADWVQDVTVELETERLAEYTLVKQQDDSYKTQLENMTVSVTAEAGYFGMYGNVSIMAEDMASLDSQYDVTYVYTDTYNEMNNITLYLDAARLYTSEWSVVADSGKTFRLHFIVKDAAGNLLGVLDGDIVLTTTKTDEEVVLNEVTATANTITFDMEAKDWGKWYYAPVDGSAEEKILPEITSGRSTCIFRDLQPDTEYAFEYVTSQDKVCFTTTASTSEVASGFSHEVDAVFNERNNSINLNIHTDISGYTGNATSVAIHYTYTDYFGSTVSSSEWHEISSETESVNTTITPMVLAGTTCDFTIWTEFSDLTIPKKVFSVAMPDASFTANDVTFTVVPDENSVSAVNANIQVNDVCEEEYSVPIFYKVAGVPGTYRNVTTYISNIDDKASGSAYIYDLVPGETYEFVLVIGGVMVTKTYQLAGTPKLSLVQVGEGETNAFDIVRTYKIVSEEELEGSYYIHLFMYDESGNEEMWNSVELNAENNYQATISTAAGNRYLAPDTDYSLKCSFGNIYPYGFVYEKFRTAKHNTTIEKETDEYNYQKFKLTFADEDVKNYGGKFGRLLNIYFRKKGNSYYRDMNKTVYFSSYDDCDAKLEFYNLTENTEYEVSLRDDYGVEYIAFAFATPKDMREITYVNTYIDGCEADVVVKVSGVTEAYLAGFIREKGNNYPWEKGAQNIVSEYSSTDNFAMEFTSYQGESLKEGTTYEYTIGFVKRYDEEKIEEIEKPLVGEFTTKSDARSLTNVKVDTDYTRATINALYRNEEELINSYVHAYYREKNAESWKYINYSYAWNDKTSLRWQVDNLTPATEYEYLLAITSSYSVPTVDTVAENKKYQGEFTTAAGAYTLDFAVDETKLGYDEAVINVTAKDSTADASVDVELTLSDGQKKTVNLNSARAYKGSVIFDNLTPNTTYTITNAELSIVYSGAPLKIAELPCEFAFTTKVVEVPSELKLSQDTLNLNAAYQETALEGINSASLTVESAGDELSNRVLWESDNVDVVTVVDGHVIAHKAGTATITATSVYDENVKATCKVTVKDYVVGCMMEDELHIYDTSDATVAMYKGEVRSGLALYERIADEAPILVESYTVTPAKRGIVSIENNTITAKTVGDTSLIYEANDVKAVIHISVAAQGKGFGINGFHVSNPAFPAIRQQDGSYVLAFLTGTTYFAEGEIVPSQPFYADAFTWSSSNEEIVTVDAYGEITPVGVGTATLTVAPKAGGAYVQESVEIVLHVKGLPRADGQTEFYALQNVHKTLNAISLGDTWSDEWTWKAPTTPLVTNGINTESTYTFPIVYTGTTCYPREVNVSVKMAKITGATVNADHNGVLELDDSMTVTVAPIYEGNLSEDLYTIELPNVKNLDIVEHGDGTYTVTAQKKGSYTLKPVVKSGTTVLAKPTYKFKAVDTKQVEEIVLTTDTEGVTITDNSVIFASKEAMKNFTLHAEVTDSSGELSTTALKWESSDKSVAAVAQVSAKNTQNAKVTMKGTGHTVIKVTAKDTAACMVTLNVEVQDHTPRISTKKATVNIAYDYQSIYGQENARKNGLVEIVPVYGETITNVELLDKEYRPSTQLKIVPLTQNEYLVAPMYAYMQLYNKLDCTLRVWTNTGRSYDYPLTVKVEYKMPSISVRMTQSVNLFYTTSTGEIAITKPKDVVINSVHWSCDKNTNQNGFSMVFTKWMDGEGNITSEAISVQQEPQLKVENGKLADTSLTKGYIYVTLQGYRDYHVVRNFTIKTAYKKPNLVTMSATSNVALEHGINAGDFSIYDKTNKRYMMYVEDADFESFFNKIECDNKDVEITTTDRNYIVDYTYNGTNTNQRMNLQLDSPIWRETLTATHTMKSVEPKAALADAKLVFHVNGKTQTGTYVYSNNVFPTKISEVVVTGTNAKAQELLDDDIFVITTDGENINIKQNDASKMKKTLKKGSYSFKVVPYCMNAKTGKSYELNALTLKLDVIDKPATVKVSAKGALDLTDKVSYASYEGNANRKNVITVNKTLTNVPSGYVLTSQKLVGEYSEYFVLKSGQINQNNKYMYCDYLTIRDNGKLKAGQTYKLAIEYTFIDEHGDSFTVTSNTFNVKPKQTAAKVTVANNGQTIYAGSNTLSKIYELSVPYGYTIESVSGSLDSNKDGRADIVVNGTEHANVTLSDKDAIVATANGKAYTIPVTVKLSGRDGVSKDTTVSLKVKVCR